MDRSQSGQTQESDDDVIYMYSVDPASRVAPMIDLTREGEISRVYQAVENANSAGTKFVVQTRSMTKALTTKESSKEAPAPAKPPIIRKRKQSSEARCVHCDRSYYLSVKDLGDTLYTNRCGHIMCIDCATTLPHCSVCSAGICNLWKVYL